MVVYGLTIKHIVSYQYMVGIIPGNATSFMCSLLGRYYRGSIILQWVSLKVLYCTGSIILQWVSLKVSLKVSYCKDMMGFDHSGSKPFNCYLLVSLITSFLGKMIKV